MDKVRQPRPLFMIGNKRSGTSHLVRLLNLHPQVCVTHESDIIWLLWQVDQGMIVKCYPWDGPVGMEATLQACSDIFQNSRNNVQQNGGVRNLFMQVQHFLMKNGSHVQGPHTKDQLLWIGDKKPVQQADPALRPFLLTHFPDARYVHIIRHPQAVVGSSLAFQGHRKVKYWTQSAETILERWAIHEEWVVAAQQQDRLPIFSFRFEERRPGKRTTKGEIKTQMSVIWEFEQ